MHQPTDLTSKALLQACAEGHRQSMEMFYKAALPLLWPVACRYSRDDLDARDILNTAMMKVFKALHQFDGHNIHAWMKTIVINTGIDAIRSRQRHSSSGEITPAMENNTALTYLDDQLSEADLLDALRRLPEHLRVVLLLHAVDGYSHEEIGKQLGITPNNSRWRLHQARQQMKSILTNLELIS